MHARTQDVPNNHQIFHAYVERIKLSQKVLYDFIIFPIVKEIIINF